MPRQDVAIKAPTPVYAVARRTAITASSERINAVATRRAIRNKQDASWQQAAWTYFDSVGEFEYVANWVGNIQSRGRLEVRFRGEVVDEGPAKQALDEFFGSESGRSECLKADGVYKTVAGEHYIVSWLDGGVRRWEMADASEVTEDGSTYKLGTMRLPEDALIIRSYRKHPYRRDRVHAPSIAALPILAEIDGLTKHIAAQIDSRLTTAGLLLMPNEIAFTSSTTRTEIIEGETVTTAVTSTDSNELINTLIEVASTAISDPASAAATVPVVITADGEHLDKVKLIKFWSELDNEAKGLRSEAIRRLALSLDVPPEALLGSGDANHWSMWSVDESSIKSHVEPNLMSFCHDITTGYLIPAIKGLVPDADLPFYQVTVDSSEMRLRPNRSKEAAELYDRGVLTAAALLRETGFDDKYDIPSDDERATWVQLQAAKGSATPSIMVQAYRELGWKDVKDPVEEGQRGDLPDPSLKDNPRPELTDPELLEKDARRKSEQASLLGACEIVVFRVLERFGNKAKSKLRFNPEGVEPSEFYLTRQFTTEQIEEFLEGSFDVCDRVAKMHSVGQASLRSAVLSYTMGIITGQRIHSREELAAALEEVNG